MRDGHEVSGTIARCGWMTSIEINRPSDQIGQNERSWTLESAGL